jgi:hypothetical protein
MARAGALALVAVVLAGLAGLLVAGGEEPATPGVDLGIPAGSPIVTLKRGHEVCQGPIALDEDVRAAEFTPAPGGRRGPAMEVTLRASGGGRVLSRARVPSEVMTGQPRRVSLAPAGAGRAVDFCVRSLGRQRVQIWGDVPTGSVVLGQQIGHPTLSTSGASVDGKPIDAELFVRFPKAQRSVLAESPTLVERLSRFRAPFYGPALTWLLVAVIALGGPWLLIAALRASARD